MWEENIGKTWSVHFGGAEIADADQKNKNHFDRWVEVIPNSKNEIVVYLIQKVHNTFENENVGLYRPK